MAEPTARFRTFPRTTTTTTQLDSAAKRIGTITGESVVSTTGGQEHDLGIVDITGGQADSAVEHVLWDITADGGNTVVDTFRVWLSLEGFTEAGTLVYLAPLRGSADGGTSNTDPYVQSAITSSYPKVAAIATSEPSQNVWPSDEGTVMSLSTTSDDACLWAHYVAVDASEITGTYKGTDSGKEFQYSFKYNYS